MPSFEQKQRLLPTPKNPLEEIGSESNPVLQAVLTVAKDRDHFDAAGNLDLSNLRLRQGGLTYVVNQRTESNPTIERTPVGGRPWRPSKIAPTSDFSQIGTKQTMPRLVDNPKSVVDLDVYDSSNNLIAKRSFDGSGIYDTERRDRKEFVEKWPDGLGEFLLFLGSHAPDDVRNHREETAVRLGHHLPPYLEDWPDNSHLPRGPIIAIGWGKTNKAPAEINQADRKDIDIPLKANEDILDQIFRNREHLSIPGNSLLGLTLMVGGRKLQITQDELLNSPNPYAPDPPDSKITRIWEITEYEYDANGQPSEQVRRVYRNDSLRDLLNKGGFRYSHWEIPKEVLRNTARMNAKAAIIGKLALRPHIRLDEPPSSWGTKAKFEFARLPGMGFRKISIDESFEFLCSPDIYTDEQVRTKAGQLKLDKRPEDISAAKSLRRLVQRFGTIKIRKAAEQLRGDYVKAARMLGLAVPREKTSLSWALRYIAKRNYMARWDWGEARSRGQRREIVDYEIGLSFLDEALKPALDADKDNYVNEKGFVESVLKAKLGLQENKKLTRNLQEFVEPEVKQILDKLSPQLLATLEKSFDPKTNKVPEHISDDKDALKAVDRATLVHLGRLLRRQLLQ